MPDELGTPLGGAPEESRRAGEERIREAREDRLRATPPPALDFEEDERELRDRRGYLFCLVMAGIACLFQPFGMILGVFTFIVLLRPSVKTLFGRAAPAAPPTS